MNIEQMKRVVEAALLSSSEPLKIKGLVELFSEEEKVNNEAVKDIIKLLQEDYAGRGIELVEVATGYRFQACADLAPWLHRMKEEKPGKYSRALLETLSLIAYKQPITRGEIEEVRGVAVSSDIIRKLEEREWIRVIGHRDVPGKPALFATTSQFLDDLNLKSLAELPTLAELKNLDQADDVLKEQLSLDMEAEDQEKAAEPEQFEHEAQNLANEADENEVVAEINNAELTEHEESHLEEHETEVELIENEAHEEDEVAVYSGENDYDEFESEDYQEFDMIPEPA